MKFNYSIIVNKPVGQVAALFIDPQYLGKYQEGFLRKENVSGTPGEKGTVAKMYYKMGKGEMEITETIRSNNLPKEFEAFYHHKHMDNTLKATFTPIDEQSTRYETVVEYTAFRGIMPKLMSIFFKGMFRKQVQRWLDNFKGFVENKE